MNKAQALAVLQASFARGSSTPCTWTTDRVAYLSEKSSELLASAIEPVEISISGEVFSQSTSADLNTSRLFAIANEGHNWLIYSPERELFALAYGASLRDLNILGFSSDDALTEWLG